MEKQSIWDAIGGRKFVGFVIAIAAGVVMAVFGVLNNPAVALILGALGIYCGSNALITRKALGAAKAAVDGVKEVVGGDGP